MKVGAGSRGAILLFVACAAVLLVLGPQADRAESAMIHVPQGSFGDFDAPAGLGVIDSSGDVLVIDTSAATVTRFDRDGNLKDFPALGTPVLDGKGTGECVVVPTACDRTPQNGFSFDRPNAAQVAVDNSSNPLTAGNIYVSDSFNRVVDVFSSDGKYLGQLANAGATGGFGETCGVAVDPAGALLVGDYSWGVHRFVPSANPPLDDDFVSSVALPPTCEIAAGAAASAGAVFANRWQNEINKVGESGSILYSFGAEVMALAVDPGTGNVITVGGDSGSEYDASGDSEAALESTIRGPFGRAEGVAVAGGSGTIYVSDAATGKIFAFGPAMPAQPPTIGIAGVKVTSSSSAKIYARINPRGSETTYRVEFGTEPCSSAMCASIPLAGNDFAAGNGFGIVNVSQALQGLKSGSEYFVRITAANPGGTSVSGEAAFRLSPSTSTSGCPNASIRNESEFSYRLPDCRALELVSAVRPTIRNGMDVLENTQTVRAAVDGAAFKFSAISGTSDAVSVPFLSEYMGIRGVNGWEVRPVSPRQPGLSLLDLFFGAIPRYVGEFSPNLDQAIFHSKGTIGSAGPPAGDAGNLYRASGLTGNPTFDLLTGSPIPQEEDSNELIRLAATSADFRHILFESTRALTADAVALGEGTKLYESDNGVVRLAGVLPVSEGGGPTLAEAGRGALEETDTRRTMSLDGSRYVFTAGTPERIYLRDTGAAGMPDDDESVLVNASEKTNGGGPGGQDPNGSSPATFWGASRDLGVVLFSSAEALTNSAPTSSPGTQKLYRYSAGAPQGARLTLLSVDEEPVGGLSSESNGVVAASDDASIVYFLAGNQLQAGGPTASRERLFVWRDGVVREVTAVNGGKERSRLLGTGSVREDPKWARITPDGSRLVFVSQGTVESQYDHGTDCPALDLGGCQEVYVYDLETEGLACASCPSGRTASADADFNSRGPQIFVPKDPYESRAITDDGRLVFFNTAERLSSYDRNDEQDVYAFDTVSGEQVLLSAGTPAVDAHFLDASADGSDVFFLTRAQLATADRNDLLDVYDARVGGGFAAPAPSPDPCVSETSCRPVDPEAVGPVGAIATAVVGQGSTGPKRSGKERKKRQSCKKQRAHRGSAQRPGKRCGKRSGR